MSLFFFFFISFVFIQTIWGEIYKYFIKIIKFNIVVDYIKFLRDLGWVFMKILCSSIRISSTRHCPNLTIFPSNTDFNFSTSSFTLSTHLSLDLPNGLFPYGTLSSTVFINYYFLRHA